MPDLIRLSRASLEEEEKNAVSQVINDGYLGMGQQVMSFEKELEAFFSNKVNVVCVNTGTSALHLAVQACDIGIGDEVLVPSITYVASFQAISATGATPIACDINLSTGCLDIDAARKRITSHTKAIMYVHYAGSVGNRDALFLLAKEYNLRVIEDAAHSFGGYHQGKRIGIDGDITCFSFDGIKNITAGEGGSIVSNDKNIISRVKDLRLLGVQKDTDQRYSGKRSWDFEVTEQGWRYHMSDLNASIGRVQLKKIDIFGEKRRELSQLYIHLLQDTGVEFLDLDLKNSIPHIFPVLVPENTRDSLRSYLLDNSIETGIHYKPNHLLKKFLGTTCENAEIFSSRILSLPLHCQMGTGDVRKVSTHIKNFMMHKND